MKITMITLGSLGDVRPYVILGKELTRRGHQVTIATFASFEQLITDAGLGFHSFSGSAMQMMDHLMKPGVKLFSYMREVGKAVGEIASTLMDEMSHSCEDADILITTFLGNAPYSVAEYHNIPCIQTHFFPMDPSPLMPMTGFTWQNLGGLVNRLSYRLGYFFTSLLEVRYLTGWRKAHQVSARGLHSKPDYICAGHRVPVIYACSSLLFPRYKGWDEHTHLSGFWTEESSSDYIPPQSLTDFLSAGDPPIYLGFGSMTSGDMAHTFQIVQQALEMTSQRAVILGGWAGYQAKHPTDRILCVDSYVPHDWLFRHVSAAVYHGGAGTTCACLRAGLPVLVIPFGGDQPFWGARVHAAGCGPKPLPRTAMTAPKLAQRLRALTSNESYRAGARALGAQLRQEQGVQNAADLIEREVAAWQTGNSNTPAAIK